MREREREREREPYVGPREPYICASELHLPEILYLFSKEDLEIHGFYGCRPFLLI